MDFIYLLLLAGVALAVFSALFEAIAALNRKPSWEQPAEATTGAAPQLELVATIDRRKQQMPYVGEDRRRSAAPAAAPAEAQHDAS